MPVLAKRVCDYDMLSVVKKYDVLVVGAGIAGLMCARSLSDRGRSVLVVEREPKVGGRMATCRFDNAVFDFGAQFFTVTDLRFSAVVRELERRGVVRVWSTGYVNDEGALTPNGQVRYCGVPDMSTVCSALAEPLDVETGSEAVRLEPREKVWGVHLDASSIVEAQAMVLTQPPPESLELLDSSGVSISRNDRTRLSAIAYEPTITLLAICDEPHPLPGPGAVQLRHGPVQWIADNRKKGISPDRHALTIHAGHEFSRTHIDDRDDGIVAKVRDALQPWLDLSGAAVEVKRWRYARAVPAGEGVAVRLETPSMCICAGDGFAGPRVESAALSGIGAAEMLADR